MNNNVSECLYVVDMLAGKIKPRYLVYSTGKGSYPYPGGFASRIKGITTVFFLALLTSKPLSWLLYQYNNVWFVRESLPYRMGGSRGIY